MYPYNTNTRLSAKKQPATTRLQSRAQQDTPLATDRRLHELLLIALEQTEKTEQQYAALLAEEALADAADTLRTMQIDEKKHQRILREILFAIYGTADAEDTPESPDTGETDVPESLADFLETLLFAEMDEVGFYRELLFAMEEQELRDFFYEIISNKQNHATALQHLYAKYLMKNTGHSC